MRTRFAVLFSAFALLAAFHPLSATTRIWPGAAPCNTTLQACITGSAASDVVEVATNSTVSESITIDKTLTLRPGTGFTPVISGFTFLQSTAVAADITVQGLSFNCRMRAAPGTANLTIHILNNTITTSGSFGTGLDISSGTFPPYGNMFSEVLNNTITVTGGGPGDQCGGIHVGLIFDSGISTASVVGNTVNVTNCGQGDAILAVNGPNETMTVDIIGNHVTANGTNVGIELRNFQQTAGPALFGRVINNLVTGQLSEAGFPGAIVISADGHQPLTAYVINNTVTGNHRGIGVSARTDLGASITGVVANNIAAFNTTYGLTIDPDSEPAVANSNNLVFGNSDDYFTEGPGTLRVDPQFAGAGNFHLGPASPAINRGSNTQVPVDITTDLDGSARIRFGVVDIGAFEAALMAARGDFQLDGKADLFWRNSTSGSNSEWLMSGPAVAVSATMPVVSDTNFRVAGIGDFQNDGKSDLLWRNLATGANVLWLLNGTTVAVSAMLPDVPDLNWTVAGVGDFQGDGKADILWRRNITGDNSVWLMNGTALAAAASLPSVPDANWQVVGIGDFQGDGRQDVLWRHSASGANVVWLMNGTTIAVSAILPTVADLNWKVAGLGDLQGDAKADIVWRNSATGNNSVWLMDGTTVALSAALTPVADTNWKIARIADFQGDGKADIVWRNSATGSNSQWLMNGSTVAVSSALPAVPDINWQIAGGP